MYYLRANVKTTSIEIAWRSNAKLYIGWIVREYDVENIEFGCVFYDRTLKVIRYKSYACAITCLKRHIDRIAMSGSMRKGIDW